MAKKSDTFYYDNFKTCASISCEAAAFLDNVVGNFDVLRLSEDMGFMHSIEHKADDKKHEMTAELVKAFITPLDREDIIKLSQSIDNVTDALDDILIKMYMTNITALRDDCKNFCGVITGITAALEELFDELYHFKKSKKIKDIIIEINRLEEEGDRLYVTAMRRLHKEVDNVPTIIAWRDIYSDFEEVCDACEDVADIVESITIENT